MDKLFDGKGFLRKDADAETLQEYLQLPSGSEDELTDFGDSDEDPTVRADDLEIYTSSDDSSGDESPPHSTKGSTSKANQSDIHEIQVPQVSLTASGTQMRPQTSSGNTFASKPIRMQCTWKKKNIFLPEEDKKFKGDLEYPESILHLDTPFQFVKYFLTDELIKKIVSQSMLYAAQKDPNKVFEITSTDIQKYLGICLLTSVTHNDNIRDFWNDKIGMELVKNTMSLNYFEKLRASLHFNDNEKEIPRGEPGHDKLYKIRPVIESLLETFSSIRMEESLSIDEQMCATKVRHSLRQYMQNKPHKWGYKLFVLCSTAGYAYKFEIYSGQENNPASRPATEPDLGASSNVVVRLARSIPKNLNHKLYFDNYYTSLPLPIYLKKQGILGLGTARRNRIPDCKLPTDKELSKTPRGTSVEYVANVDGVDVSSVIWKDNKCVIFLSTFTGKLPEKKVKRYERSTKSHKEVDCPEVVDIYNKHMGGVDLLDSHLGHHNITLKSKKWYFRLFYHMIDLAVINAWILYKEVLLQKDPTAKVLNQKNFRIEIAGMLCRMGTNGQKRGRPSNDIQQLLDAKKKKCPRAVVPPKDLRQDSADHWPNWNGKRNRCKLPGCNGFSFISCTKCKVYLCLNKDKNCFTHFHK